MAVDESPSTRVRILVVEDEAILARDLRETLRDLGYGVVGLASSASEAVEMAREHAPDLVLSDIRMPGDENGIDAAGTITDELDIPVVFLTAYADRDTLRRVTRTEPYGYILKPFDTRELEAAVELALQRKRRERAFRERERWFERVLGRVEDIVAVVDATGTVEYVNPAVQDVLGYAPGERVGQHSLELVHPDDRESFEEALAAAFRELGRPLEAEARFRSADGGWRLLELVGRVYASGTRGSRPRLVVNARDVTERRAQQRRLEASQERYRVLFEEGIAGAFQATTGGELLEANEALAEMLAYGSAGSLAGRPMEEIFHPDDWTSVLDRLKRDGTAVNLEVRARRRSDESAVLLLSCGKSRVPDRPSPVVIGTAVDITERKRLEADLEWMAYHDALTGLVNRRYLTEQGSRYLSLAERREDRLGLVYLDLARFKAINDSLGHEAGDAVLSQVAGRLQREARESDVVARVGGDEFVVLMPDVGSAEAAVGAARRLSRTLEEPVELEDEQIPAAGHLGVAVYPDHASSFEDLLAAADAAMYQVKSEGDRAVGLYREGIPSAVARTEAGETLRTALDADELLVHYQPIVQADDDAVVGLEALLRWRRPEGRTSTAGEFLPLVRRSGLAAAFDDRMLELVRRDLSTAELPEGVRWISVNLTPATLSDPAVTERLVALAGVLGSRRIRMTVEISERPGEDDGLSSAWRGLAGLDADNIAVALDDFGTGPSSLALLSRLRADYVKVSPTGVPALNRAVDRGEAMSGLIQLIHALDTRVVAEGVEEQEDGRQARREGADFLQGYALGRPDALSALGGESAEAWP